MDNEKYSKLVEKETPNSNIAVNCAKAFFVGGLICVLGQFITNIMLNFGMSYDNSAACTSVILIFLASLLTGLGVYSKLGKFAGAGSIVPVTGFSNSVTSPAIEYKSEGFVLGVGAKIFAVAGPVLLYGSLASIAVGIVYYIGKNFIG